MSGETILMIVVVFFSVMPFILYGVSAFIRKTPINFWTGDVIPSSDISDIKAYNRANGIMWILAGIIITALSFLPAFFKSDLIGILLIILIPMVIL